MKELLGEDFLFVLFLMLFLLTFVDVCFRVYTLRGKSSEAEKEGKKLMWISFSIAILFALLVIVERVITHLL